MQFTGTYDVTVDDYAYPARLARRPRDTLVRMASNLLMLANLRVVAHLFGNLVHRALLAPCEALNLLLLNSDNLQGSVFSWTAVIIYGSLVDFPSPRLALPAGGAVVRPQNPPTLKKSHVLVTTSYVVTRE